MFSEPVTAPLKLIFAKVAEQDGDNVKIKHHVAFYDLFGGIAEVVNSDDSIQPEKLGSELIIAPLDKYDFDQHEVLTLWIKPDEKEKIGQAIRDIFDKQDPLSAIFSGKQVNDSTGLTDVSFCVEALRAALTILPDIPVNCITIQKLYTVLKMMGGI